MRTSISRAYYSVFRTAYNHVRDVEKDPLIPSGPDAHKYVVGKFRGSHDDTRKGIGNRLDRLRLDRNRADYNDTVPGLAKMTDASLRMADLAMRALSAL